MSWIRVAILCCLVPVLHGQKDCTKMIRWKEMFKELNNLNSNISPECGHDFNNTVLCNPREMLHQAGHSPVVFMDIMDKAESIYGKISNSEKVLQIVQHTSRVLQPCVPHTPGAAHEPVTTCFGKLEAFLNNKKFCPRCAGEIANLVVREILQRLEKRTERRRRR